MLASFNQIAYFKSEKTAKRLKNYYYSGHCRPTVFLSYLRLINIVATLCLEVAQLSVALYHQEVRELFFTHRDNPEVIRHLWHFRRFFTPVECCRLLQVTVLKGDLAKVAGFAEAAQLPIISREKRRVSRSSLHKNSTDFLSSAVECSENSVKTVDISRRFRYFCTNEKPTRIE